jgi:penicillin-binding protein 1C
MAAKREPVPEARLAFPALAAHAAEEAVGADKQAKVIKLSIDARLQAKLEVLGKESVARLGSKLSTAIVVVDNASGEVRARVGSADYNDATRDGAIDMSRAPRSPGSALKPFIYALAFEQGLAHPETRLFDRPMRYGAYAPENFNLAMRARTRKALQMSLNPGGRTVRRRSGHFPRPAAQRGRRHCAAEGRRRLTSPSALGVWDPLTDIARLYAGFARGEALPLIERLDGQPPVIGERRTDPVAAYYVGTSCARAGARQRAQRPDRLDRAPLTASRRARDVSTMHHDRVRLGAPDNGPTPGPLAGAAALILFDAFGTAWAKHRADLSPEGRLESDSPPPSRPQRLCARRAQDPRRRGVAKIAPPNGARFRLGPGGRRGDHPLP